MDLKKKKILIIEDDDDVREATKTNLELAGYRNLFTAPDGEKGLKMVQHIRPALVLLDRKMPGKDGLEVLEAIKESYGEEVVVVILTAYRDKDYITDAMRKGAFHYLVKDDDPEFMHHTIESALRYHQKNLQRQKIEREIYELMIQDETFIRYGYDFDRFKMLLEEKTRKLIDNVVHSIVKDCSQCGTAGFAGGRSQCIFHSFSNLGMVDAQNDQPTILFFYKSDHHPFFEAACSQYVPKEKVASVKTLVYVVFTDRAAEKLKDFFDAVVDNQELVRYCCIYLFSANAIRFSLEEKKLLRRFFDRFLVAMRTARLVDKIDSLNKMRVLGDMATTVVHQISPMITPLRNYLSNPTEQNRKQGLQIIDDLKKMVDEFRNFTEGISQEYDMEPLNLATVISQAEIPIRLKFEEKITIRHDFRHSIPTVLGDRKRLQQAFENLLMNSAQAILARNGNTGEIEIQMTFTNHNICIYIRDNGPGIDPQIVSKLFKSYVTTKRDGMGLGLNLTYEIIKRHRGKIEYNPNYKCGAEFIIYLPAYQPNGFHPQQE